MFDHETVRKGFKLIRSKVKNPEHNQLNVGDEVTLRFMVDCVTEDLVAVITLVGASRYEGSIHSVPNLLSDVLQWGDFVEFRPEHIHDEEDNDDNA